MNIQTVAMHRPSDDPVLAGRLNGKRAFASAIEQVAFEAPTIVVLDFRSVALATSSFLSEVVLPLRDHLRTRQPPGFVVVANLTETVREELDDLLTRSSDAVMSCSTTAGGVSNAKLLGTLEHSLRETFDLVKQKGEASAVELYSESGESKGVGPTAWNNRLAMLAAKSLLIELPRGRAKKYRPVLEMT